MGELIGYVVLFALALAVGTSTAPIVVPEDLPRSEVVLGAGSPGCHPLKAEAARGLGSEWERFAPFIKQCEIALGHGKPALGVVSVWLADYYRALPGKTAERVKAPKAVLFSNRGRQLGSLPIAFPDDPLDAYELTFRDWRRGFPQEIRIKVKSPTVSGDRELPPLRWDPKGKAFRPARQAPLQ